MKAPLEPSTAPSRLTAVPSHGPNSAPPANVNNRPGTASTVPMAYSTTHNSGPSSG